MNTTRKNVIIATEKIIDLSGDERRKLLLTLLETNPSCVLRALEIGVPPKPIKLFKVVLVNAGCDKINAIKAFLNVTNSCLVDAKAWSEGKEYNGLPSGVMAKNMTESDAILKLDGINRICDMYNVPHAVIVDNDAEVTPLPWKPLA